MGIISLVAGVQLIAKRTVAHQPQGEKINLHSNPYMVNTERWEFRQKNPPSLSARGTVGVGLLIAS